MQGFAEFTEEKKIIVKTKMGGEIPATIKVTGKDYHIVKADASGKQYKVDHQGNSLEEGIEDRLLSKYGSEKDKEEVHQRKMAATKRNTEHAKAQSELEKHKAEISNTQHDTHRNQHNRNVDAAKTDHERKVDVSRRDQDHERRVQGNQQHHDRMMQADKNWHDREMQRMKNSHERKMKEEIEHVDEANSFVGHKDAPEDRIKKLETRYGKLSDSEKQSVHRGLDHVVHNNRNPNRAFAKSAVIKKEETDKDLPFTPDKKKTKPSTPGKYGDAYSTVRNLARRALEKQKQVKEEEQLDEKSAQARANKARKNVMDAGRGAAYRQKTGVNLDPKTDGYPSQQAMNKALGRFLRREELDLQEAKSKQELQALMRKHEQHAIDANKRGDDAAAVKHQNYINSVKKKLEQVVRNEEVELEEGHVPDDHGRVLSQSDKEKLGKVADLMSKEKVAKQKQVKETALVAPSLGVHRIQVTVSDPDHTMVSQRKEKVQKFVRVTSNSKQNALEQGKKHFAKKGWKVHDAEHVGMVHEEVEIQEANSNDEHFASQSSKMQDAINRHLRAGKSYKDAVAAAQKHVKEEIEEGYRGNSEADKPFFDAKDHKTAAEKAHKEGDAFSYHMHMAAHHDSMAHWNANKGRHHVADLHMSKAENHEHYAQQARKGSK